MHREAASLALPFSDAELDRAGHLRTDDEALSTMLADPSTKLLELVATKLPVNSEGAIAWCPIDRALSEESFIFLGLDSEGVALFAVDRGDDESKDGYFNLRDVGAGLSRRDAAAALAAVALTTWHRRHRYCASCGLVTAVSEAGHARRCASCGATHHPRMDPAVIMLVSDGERCVLGRRPGAPEGRWSTLAGYVEPGETLEAAVKREVAEEVGITVKAVEYCGSQPWPFPSSLMLVFNAEADHVPLVVNFEHQEARWFSRAELSEALSLGRMTIPPPTAAGHYLIKRFLG